MKSQGTSCTRNFEVTQNTQLPNYDTTQENCTSTYHYNTNTSNKPTKKRKLNKEKPMYMCNKCKSECKYEEDISDDKEFSVMCDCCMMWYHFGCADYDGEEGEWLCPECLMNACEQ